MQILKSIIIASIVTCFVACSNKSENYSARDKVAALNEGVGGGGMELEATTVELTAPPVEKSVAEDSKNMTEQKLIKTAILVLKSKTLKTPKRFYKS